MAHDSLPHVPRGVALRVDEHEGPRELQGVRHLRGTAGKKVRPGGAPWPSAPALHSHPGLSHQTKVRGVWRALKEAHRAPPCKPGGH